MINTSNWGYLVAPGLRKVMVDSYKQYEPYYPKLLNVFSSSRAYEDDVDGTGVGKLTETAQSASTTFQDPLQGYKTRYTPAEYRAGIQMSRQANEDDLYRQLGKSASMLGSAAARTYDDIAMGTLFRQSFNTANTSYGDALPLCSTVHTRIDGGSTQSNASATSIALGESGLNTGLLAVRQVLDGKGQLVNFMDAKPLLMVAPYQEKLALELVGSNLRSATADNDTNYYKHFAQFDVFINPWMSALSTGSTQGAGTDLYWFIIMQNRHSLNLFKRIPFSVDEDRDIDTQTLKMIAFLRFAYGWSDWRGLWGSKGDASSYSN